MDTALIGTRLGCGCMSVRRFPVTGLAVLLLTTGLAGCLGSDGGEELTPVGVTGAGLAHDSVDRGLEVLGKERAEPLTLSTDTTVNVVFVGLSKDRIDTDQLRENLPSTYSPRVDFSKPRGEGLRSGIEHRLSYDFHQAPTAFADELFARYPDWSEEVDIPGRLGDAPAFLERYDRMYDLGRAEDGRVHLVDAEQVETWLHEHRAEHGLAFEEPELTVFFLDSWTEHGLWEDSYYWYTFEDNTVSQRDARNMRAFGGTYDHLFMDYSAAPNDALYDNSGITDVDTFQGATSFPVLAPEGTAYNDPPIWHYDGDTATIGHGPYEKTVELTDRVEHALDIAVDVRAIGTYAYRPVYEEDYHVNVHLFHDGRSVMPTDGLDDLLDPEQLFGALQAEIPWANVTGSLDTYVLPDDDPGMARALDTAKAEAAGTYIPTKPVVDQVEAHPDRYSGGASDAFEVTALAFLLEGHYAFVLPVIVGGVALASPDGTAWGTISSVNDYRYLGNGQDMDEVAASLQRINSHEVGHFFGLMHAHEGSRPTGQGYEYVVDHTWSSTNTIMSYRLQPFTADVFHVEKLAEAHALENLETTLRNAGSAYRALDAAGVDETPDEVQDALQTASANLARAVALFEAGAPADAVEHAIDARRASQVALDAAGVGERTVRVEAWTNEGVNSAGADYDALTDEVSVVPTGYAFDYRPVEIGEDVERVTVRASWTNTPASWGDFFVGWSTQATDPVVNAGPVRYGSPVSQQGGIHDSAEEGPTDGPVNRSFTLEMDRFPIFRDNTTLYMGAGTQGNAVDGAYEVEILVTYRDHGDGALPDGAETVEQDAGELVERPTLVHGTGFDPAPERSDPGLTPPVRSPALPS